MPIRRLPNGLRHTYPQAGRDPPEQVDAINRNRWTRSTGTGGRNQSEQVDAIDRCAHALSLAELGQFSEHRLVRFVRPVSGYRAAVPDAREHCVSCYLFCLLFAKLTGKTGRHGPRFRAGISRKVPKNVAFPSPLLADPVGDKSASQQGDNRSVTGAVEQDNRGRLAPVPTDPRWQNLRHGRRIGPDPV